MLLLCMSIEAPPTLIWKKYNSRSIKRLPSLVFTPSLPHSISTHIIRTHHRRTEQIPQKSHPVDIDCSSMSNWCQFKGICLDMQFNSFTGSPRSGTSSWLHKVTWPPHDQSQTFEACKITTLKISYPRWTAPTPGLASCCTLHRKHIK